MDILDKLLRAFEGAEMKINCVGQSNYKLQAERYPTDSKADHIKQIFSKRDFVPGLKMSSSAKQLVVD